MRKTTDGLYLKSYRKQGYDHIVICHDDVPGGLAYGSLDHCIKGTPDEANMRRRLFRESRRMIAQG